MHDIAHKMKIKESIEQLGALHQTISCLLHAKPICQNVPVDASAMGLIIAVSLSSSCLSVDHSRCCKTALAETNITLKAPHCQPNINQQQRM